MLRRRSPASPELNVTAMLDMAFQLLAFFILTFRPPAVEGEIAMHMPPARPVVTNPGGERPGDDIATAAVNLAGVKTLRVTVLSSGGGIDEIRLNDARVDDLKQLGEKMGLVLDEPVAPFEQIALQVSSSLRYEEVMRVMDVCARQKLPMVGNTKKLSLTMIADAR